MRCNLLDCFIFLLGLASVSCSSSIPNAGEVPAKNSKASILSKVVVPLEIDGTTLFVPKEWAMTRSDGDPWSRNGVNTINGGWGQFATRLGPLALAGEDGWPSEGVFRAVSEGQKIDERDPFFNLEIYYASPSMPPKRTWWGGSVAVRPVSYTFDVLTIAYRAPLQKPMPYRDLLAGLTPGDGEPIGEGWRMVSRTYEKRLLWLRFDVEDWRNHGGPLPRRLAVSYYPGKDRILDHHNELQPTGWVTDFVTIELPLKHWRAKHEATEAVYEWLRTSPEKRDQAKKFVWWADRRSPAKLICCC